MCDNNNSNDIENQAITEGFQTQPQMQQQGNINTATDATYIFPEASQILPWTIPQQVHALNHDPFLLPPPVPSFYGGLFSRMPAGLQFGYDVGSSDHQMRLISESFGHQNAAPFGLHKMTAQEIMDAKALAASKSHSEAERRRRERINNHLAKLRSLLPSTTKTDKASLLAEVIQHVKELKRQTSQIAETSHAVPTESDELSVENASDEEGKSVIRASICCEDRADLLPDLINTLKALKLKTLKAEITTLGGRVKNVLFITREEDQVESNCSCSGGDGENEMQQQQQYSIASIQEALKAVMEKCNGDESSSGSAKRQRTNLNIMEHGSI